jgi:ABC-type Zn uptake system ZnuABC Zn-binding protein ZnuA
MPRSRSPFACFACLAWLGVWLALALSAHAQEPPAAATKLPQPTQANPPTQHPVVATTPDLAALLRAIGGPLVAVTTLVAGPQDPHYLDPRPSMLYALQRAELLVETGRELESGWLPVLVNNCRNPAIQAGQLGRLDASIAVRALGALGGTMDRTAGDLHRGGNPHYLSDPLCGLQVAALLRDRCALLWPTAKPTFAANYEHFRQQLAKALVGDVLAQLYEDDAEQLLTALGGGTLLPLLEQQGDLPKLGGWAQLLRPLQQSPIVADHDLWPYFAQRFGFVVFGFLEPKPGMSPTTHHLQALAERMQQAKVRAVLCSPYFPPQHAKVLQQAAGAVLVPMAHQPGARPGTDDYVAWIDHNVRALAAALR